MQCSSLQGGEGSHWRCRGLKNSCIKYETLDIKGLRVHFQAECFCSRYRGQPSIPPWWYTGRRWEQQTGCCRTVWCRHWARSRYRCSRTSQDTSSHRTQMPALTSRQSHCLQARNINVTAPIYWSTNIMTSDIHLLPLSWLWSLRIPPPRSGNWKLQCEEVTEDNVQVEGKWGQAWKSSSTTKYRCGGTDQCQDPNWIHISTATKSSSSAKKNNKDSFHDSHPGYERGYSQMIGRCRAYKICLRFLYHTPTSTI